MNLYRVIEKPSCWLIKSPATGTLRIPRDGRWEFNGDYEKPTFSPSLHELPTPEDPSRNHCFVRDGKIEYLSDCTHAMAGQTVEIPPLTEVEMSRYWPDVYDDAKELRGNHGS